MVRDIGLFAKGFVSSEDKGKLLHYILYIIYDLFEARPDLQALVRKACLAMQEFRCDKSALPSM